MRFKVNGIGRVRSRDGRNSGSDDTRVSLVGSSIPTTTRKFFVRHAYFLGANDPYQSLKTALKAEIDEGRLGKPLFRHVTPYSEAEDWPRSQ